MIYVGQTQRAEQNGVTFSQLGEEEWIIKTVSNDIILTGGRYRGTLYAVYEFLEKQVGIRWYDIFTEIVPEKSDLTIPTLDIQASPAFSQRFLVDQIGFYPAQATPSLNHYIRFKTFNKFNWYGSETFSIPQWGGQNCPGSPLPYHSIPAYIIDYLNAGLNPPTMYDISVNETHPARYCECDVCTVDSST